MDDPWKYLGFTVAGITGLLATDLLPLDDFSQFLGIQEIYVPYLIAAGSGLVIGFIVDEMLPVYLDEVRNGTSGGSSMGGGGSDDFDMDGDLDI